MKSWFWDRVGDSLLRRLADRLAHLELHRPALHDGAIWGRGAKLGTGTLVHRTATLDYSGPESLVAGEHCRLYGDFKVFAGGHIAIGHHSFVGPGSRVWSMRGITIGNHVLISHEVDVHDSNNHSLDWRRREAETIARFEHDDNSVPPDVLAAPVTIGDHAWIGFKASILKGVTIGPGAVVAACSVVTRDVAPFTMVAGNPARLVKELPR